nr:hypothetical protein BaRGS_017490 [Batillaria attramentaria]
MVICSGREDVRVNDLVIGSETVERGCLPDYRGESETLKILGESEIHGNKREATWRCRVKLSPRPLGDTSRVIQFDWFKSMKGVVTNLKSKNGNLMKESDGGFKAEVSQTLPIEADCEKFTLICTASSTDIGMSKSVALTVQVKAMIFETERSSQ